jgi:pilus assembly protein CpaF
MKEGSHIIAIVGGKGGVGKSLLSANLAISFAQETKQPVLMVDADPAGSGDVEIITGIKHKTYGEDMLETIGHEKINAQQFKSLVSKTPHKIDTSVFFNPIRMDHGFIPESIAPFCEQASQNYPLTFIDVGVGPDPIIFPFLEQATLIFVVTEPDILVISQTRKCLERLQKLMFPTEMVHLILNKHNPKGPIQADVIQANLKRKVSVMVPYEPGPCSLSLAKSQPIVLHQPNALFGKACVQLSRSIVQQKLLQRVKQAMAGKAKPKAPSKVSAAGEGDTPLTNVVKFDEKSDAVRNNLKLHVHKRLLEVLDLKDVHAGKEMTAQQKTMLREKSKKAIVDILENEDHPFKVREEVQALVKEVLDEALGLGPLEEMLADPDITEIMVNRAHQIYIEKGGNIQLSKITFSSNQQLLQVIERIVAKVGRRIDEKTPYVDARLEDGSRVHAIIPPCVIQGPMLTIRKFPNYRMEVSDLIKFGSMSPDMAEFLQNLVQAHCNIVISGGTGSGKTTLLNVISGFIPEKERILTVEDSAELNLPQEHVGRLETRPPNIEGEGEVSIRDLVRNTLRMRPDRIVVGECRGGEALDMLQAMNTGHDGSLTTVHSNSPRDCVARLETLCLFAGMDLPAKAIKEQIASAVHYVVQQSRLSDGSRKVTYITEISGMQGEVVTLQDIFLFYKEGLDENRKVKGYHGATGYVPTTTKKFDELGIKYDRSIFTPKEKGAKGEPEKKDAKASEAKKSTDGLKKAS